MNIDLHSGDAVKWAQEYDGPLFHALLCDSPYHLTSIVKRFGKEDSAPAKAGVYARGSKGFMGKDWDGGDVAFQPETWEAFMKVLHPGAFGMSFAGSRGWHRLACAIEDAGFVIHPTIFGWAYGSGFPKATRIDRAKESNHPFAGHRYGLQALKPALEPIIVFQKPYHGSPVDNMLITGAGALNIDGGRIEMSQTDAEGSKNNWKPRGYELKDSIYEFGTKTVKTEQPLGRWPANFILLDDGAAQRLDAQSGHLISGKPAGVKKAQNNIYGEYGTGLPLTGYGDSGGASRFFFRVQEQIDEADPVFYQAKAGREERDAGLEDFEEQRGSVDYRPDDDGSKGLQSRREGATVKGHNPHPTVKPIALARYLATLLLPPDEYSPRRLFVPFSGVASECIGAMQAGWEEITGVELTEEYIPIAQARLEYWKKKGWQASMFPEV